MRRLVYVSGKLGAGKTSLAFPLAAELGYSLVTKDLVKETLHDALHVPGEGEIDRAWSRRLGGASMELMFAPAARAGDMVIEANFHPHSEYERDKLRGLGGSVVEVHCACPAEVAVARYNARSRHEVHVLKEVTLAWMERYDRPVGIGSLITVDTTAPVDVAAVAAEVRRAARPNRSLTVNRRFARRWRSAVTCDPSVIPHSRQIRITVTCHWLARMHVTKGGPGRLRRRRGRPFSKMSHHLEVTCGRSTRQLGRVSKSHGFGGHTPMAFSLWSRRAGGGPALRGGIRAIACKNFF
jgi:predicted kinase